MGAVTSLLVNMMSLANVTFTLLVRTICTTFSVCLASLRKFAEKLTELKFALLHNTKFVSGLC